MAGHKRETYCGWFPSRTWRNAPGRGGRFPSRGSSLSVERSGTVGYSLGTMIRTGTGIDAHRFAEGRALVLGGVPIDHSRGLAGHSDADVLTHAIMDALLGATADGDIGQHFPDTASEWKGARSVELLETVAERVRSQGFRVNHIDATVMAEQPKLAPHIVAMREQLAAAMGVPLDRVSVKATTVERMGAIGREEGMAALATATVEREE